MKTELILKFSFVASHSLADYETPHPHVWKVETIVSGTPVDGWIVDMMKLKVCIEGGMTPLNNVYLNEFQGVTPEVRKYPTCETLSSYFFGLLTSKISDQFKEANPTIRLDSVLVAICGMDGHETGAVRVTAKLESA